LLRQRVADSQGNSQIVLGQAAQSILPLEHVTFLSSGSRECCCVPPEPPCAVFYAASESTVAIDGSLGNKTFFQHGIDDNGGRGDGELAQVVYFDW